MQKHVHEAVNLRRWAIVGASNDRAKFGNRIYRDLRDAGYTVFAVNPNADEVEGDPTFQTLRDIPGPIDVADIVVPASVGMTVVADAVESGIRFFWLQPGAESPELIAEAESAGLQVIHDRCAMVEKIRWSEGKDCLTP